MTLRHIHIGHSHAISQLERMEKSDILHELFELK